MTSEITVDTRAFNQAVTRLTVELAKDAAQVLEQAGKQIVTQIVQLTPPGTQARPVSQSRKAGQATVEGDIRKVFAPTTRRKAQAGVDIPRVHQAHRNSRGRTRKARPINHVPSADLNAFIRQKKQKVGYLAGGWNRAAGKFNARLPAYVKNQGTPGYAELKVRRGSIHLKATNQAAFASNVRGLERKIQYALKVVTGKMLKQLDIVLAKRTAKRAGFR